MWFIVILSHLTEDGTAFTYESNHSLPHRSGDSCDLQSRKGQTRQTNTIAMSKFAMAGTHWLIIAGGVQMAKASRG